jgi:hypothetical protein
VPGCDGARQIGRSSSVVADDRRSGNGHSRSLRRMCRDSAAATSAGPAIRTPEA